MNVVVFDDGLGELAPLRDLRPIFDCRTGAFTTLERIRGRVGGASVSLFVPPELELLTRERHSAPVNRLPDGGEPVLLVSGRSVMPPVETVSLRVGEMLVEEGSDDLIAARLEPNDARRVLAGERFRTETCRFVRRPALLSRPWHVRTFRDEALRADLDYIAAPVEGAPFGVLRAGEGALSLHETAKVYPGVTLDLERGPIFIAEHAVVRPGSVVVGPAWIGPHSSVLDRSIIKANTAIGPWCKVAGEVGGTIFQGYSNKGHDGHLGDSWLGEWVNFGAGTTNSNLLNTYGEVVCRASPSGPNERSGEVFLGAVVADHVKTAIMTRIMTGAVIHTGSMWAATAPIAGCIAPFSWVTDGEGSTVRRHYRLEKFLEVMRAAMSRRGVEPSPAYMARIAEVHSAATA